MSGNWPVRWAGLAGAAAIGLAVAPVPATAVAALSGGTGASGTTWTIQPSPNPRGASGSTLSGVSCQPGGTCMAVGSYTEGANGQFPLAMRRTGATWSITPAPRPPGVRISLFRGVSCASPRFCVAVGFTRATPSTPATGVLVERWNGASWAPEGPRAVGSDALLAVSCPLPSYCLAVGGGPVEDGTVEGGTPLAYLWNGRTWAQLAAPHRPALNGSSFTGVDCVAVNTCEIVGVLGYGEGDQAVFGYRFDGKTWTYQKESNRGFLHFVYNVESSVSCSAISACTSVGFWQPADREELAERWDGTSWAVQKRPLAKPASSLGGVSCPAAASCTAVGGITSKASGEPSSTLALTWNGTAWRRAVTANPPGASNELSAVSCTAPATCVAVGDSVNGGAAATLVEVSP